MSLVGGLAAAALAFGFVEGAVVVYLRALANPAGFSFPVAPLPDNLLFVEVAREAATIFLLLGIAWAACGEGFRRFAAFAYCFGIWDLSYYGTLKALLDWPGTWLEWDILFLIPVPWVAPVLAPILVSVCLVAASLLLLGLPPGSASPLRPRDWLVETAAGGIIVASFLWNAGVPARGEVPSHYPWWLFGAGLALGLGWFARTWVRRGIRGGERRRPLALS